MRDPHEPMNPWPNVKTIEEVERPLTENDRVIANQVQPLTKGEARRNYFQRRQIMYVSEAHWRNAAVTYCKTVVSDVRNEPTGESPLALLSEAIRLYEAFQASIAHFHNAQADYRDLGGKV